MLRMCCVCTHVFVYNRVRVCVQGGHLLIVNEYRFVRLLTINHHNDQRCLVYN